MADETPVEVDSSNRAVSLVCKLCRLTTINCKNKNKLIAYCAKCKNRLRKQRTKSWYRKIKQLYDSCLTCLNTFHNNLSYEPHDCTLEGIFVCDGCGRVFLQKKNIMLHVNICNKIISKMNTTVNENNGQRDSNSELELKIFKSTSRLNESSSVKKMSKLVGAVVAQSKLSETCTGFTCSICGKLHSCNSALAKHLIANTGEKPFCCKFCNKKFIWSSALNVHMRVHTREKPFYCELCNKKFTHSSTLTVHIRSHTGEKPFSCKFCNKKFTKSSTLTNHMRVHIGEKPFSCKFCNKKFTVMCYKCSYACTYRGETVQL